MTEPEQVFKYGPIAQLDDWLNCSWMIVADLGTYHTDVWGAVMYWRPCACRYVEPRYGT